MNLNLDEKRVLISGSSRGIGLAVAEAFLVEGAHVVITSRHPSDLDRLRKELAQHYPGEAVLTLRCDFTDRRAIVDLRRQIAAVWQGLDILIVNLGSGKSVTDPIPTAENFERVFQLNFNSAVDTSREFYPLIKEARGTIVYIASIAGVEATGAPIDYAVAKSGVIAFAKNLAKKAAADGIRVNCVAPGNVYFEGGSWAEKYKADPQQIQTLIETQVPLGRFARPSEIAAAVVFLASERSSFTTGACLVIDGGQTGHIG